jgi:hypothetical protein
LDGHISTAHFQTEAAAVAVFRNIRKNPIRRLLYPHLQEIVAQGKDGDSFAWGPEGILHHQSALTLTAMQERMVAVARGLCYKTFTPRTVAHPSHRYAQACWLYWDLLTDYIADFFKDNAIDIEKHWEEVRRMSGDLVRNSPVYQPQSPDPLVIPLDRNEIDQPEVPRATMDGVVRSVRPIESIEDLQKFCRYVLFQATFNHGWTHDGQYGAGGELRYATFGLRNGSIGDEADPAVLPPPKVMIEGISTNSLGLNANYGYILKDEEQDVPPALKTALEAKRTQFAVLGVDIDLIRSRINI